MVWYYYVNSFVASAASVSGQNKSIKKMSCSKRHSVEVYICMYDRALLDYKCTEKTMTVNSYMSCISSSLSLTSSSPIFSVLVEIIVVYCWCHSIHNMISFLAKQLPRSPHPIINCVTSLSEHRLSVFSRSPPCYQERIHKNVLIQ